MRLLHVVSGMDPKMGGVSQAVRTIATGLMEKGVSSEIITLDEVESPFLQGFSFLIHALGAARGPWAYNRFVFPWLLANLTRFDAVIIHGLWLYQNYAVWKAMQQIRFAYRTSMLVEESAPSLFVMPHGMLDPYFQRAPGRKLKALRNWAYWKLIEGKVANEAAGILFTCEEERELAHKTFRPYHPKRELVVGLGVEHPPQYRPEMKEHFYKQCPEVSTHTYILFLGRIHQKKGVDLLIKAYTSLLTFPTNSITTNPIPKLVIAGPGLDTSYGQEIQQLVTNTPILKDTIFFPGMLVGDSKWGAFYGCEAFILPSHQENFGIAIVEALACSKPVLISNKVNIWKEIVTAGGGLVADDTLKGTKQLLKDWVNLSRKAKRDMGQQAGNSFTKIFAISATTSHLLAALNAKE